MKILLFIILVSLISRTVTAADNADWPEYTENPFKISLNKAQHHMGRLGGIIVSDINGDDLLDFIISTKEDDPVKGKASIAAYDHYGDMIWIQQNVDIVLTGKAENEGLPGLHGPGISVSDVDDDGENEIIHLGVNNEIIIREGKTGRIKKSFKVALPDMERTSLFKRFMNTLKTKSLRQAVKQTMRTPERWSHFQIVNLEGENDDEIILQADPLPFRWLKAVSISTEKTLWENNSYIGLQHGGFRAADIDGDGFDEVVGGVMIDHDGTIVNQWKYRDFNGHFDSLFIGDMLPDKPGLEWVILEEGQTGDDRTALIGRDEIFFYHSLNGQEPQNAAIGEFDTNNPGLEIWCRSRYNRDQKPWVIDASGKTMASYRLNDKKPKSWSEEGIEVIYSIDWGGGKKHFIAAKERHVNGKIAIIDPLKGEFMRWWDENAARIYVADVAGDYREEIIVINSSKNEIRIYWNEVKNKDKKDGRYWRNNYYKRQKLNYNYYSP